MEKVDLALCLAVDASSSVDYDEFGLMLGGYAAALGDESVQAAITAGPRGAVAICMLQWSGRGAQAVAVPWTRLDGPAAATAFAGAVESAPRLVPAGATALGEGMAASLALLGALPTEASRLVLMILMASVIAIAMKLVGVLLITSLLIIPAATARRLSATPEVMAVVAAVLGAIAVVGGLFGSRQWDTASGPSIVVMALLLFLISLALPVSQLFGRRQTHGA